MNERPSTFPIHFVLGTGRCGSSLLHEILCHHPDVRFISNLDDRFASAVVAGRWNSRIHRALPPAAGQKGRLRFAPSEAYRAMNREVGTVLSEPVRDLVAADATPWLTRRTEQFFRQWWARTGDGTVVHKWTGWPRAGFLNAVFPGAKFVHVVRDGRAVVNSWLQTNWWRGYQGPDHWQWGPLTADEDLRWERSGRSFPALGALLWSRLIDAAADAAALLPEGQWIDLRYEDLLADQVAVVDRIHEFLELAPDRSGLDRYVLDPARQDAFQRDLGDEIVADITAIMRDRLARLGYETTANSHVADA